MDERPELLTIPTELERQDAFVDLFILATYILLSWYGMQEMHLPWQPFLVGVIPLALWALTGEPAADVGYVGSIAAGLRNRLGSRRAHEWLLAYGHYFLLAVLPVWRGSCVATLRSTRNRILPSPAQ
jgi:hypothetical protein